MADQQTPNEKEWQKEWQKFCNSTLGLLSFVLGIGCIGTPCPGVWAMVSIVFVITLMGVSKNPPKTIQKIGAGGNWKDVSECKLKKPDEKYFDSKAKIKELLCFVPYFFGYFPFLFGYFFLALLAIFGLAQAMGVASAILPQMDCTIKECILMKCHCCPD